MITLSSNFLLFPDIADPDLSDIDDSDDIDTGKGDEDCGSGDSNVISSGLCILPVRKKEKIETPFPCATRRNRMNIFFQKPRRSRNKYFLSHIPGEQITF